MNETENLVQKIVEGLQEKKGKNIVTIDVSKHMGAVCKYYVICEGRTPTQISALYDSVWDYVRKETGEKPIGQDGQKNAQWIAVDYGTVIVHILLPELREFYQFENLWADAKITSIPDLD